MYATSSGTGYGSFYTTPRGGGGDTDRAAGMSTPGRSRSAPRVRAPPQPAVVAGVRTSELKSKFDVGEEGGGKRLYAEVNGLRDRLGHEIFGAPDYGKDNKGRSSTQLFDGACGITSKSTQENYEQSQLPRPMAGARSEEGVDPKFEGASGKRSKDVRERITELWPERDGAKGKGNMMGQGVNIEAFAHEGKFRGAAGASSQDLRAIGRHVGAPAAQQAQGQQAQGQQAQGQQAQGQQGRPASHEPELGVPRGRAPAESPEAGLGERSVQGWQQEAPAGAKML